jgi:hypothetical protein
MGSNAIKGLTVEINGETTGLDAALNNVGKHANAINKELAQVEKGLKFDPKNTVLLGQKQELLKEKIADTKQALSALQQAQERVEAMYKSGEIDHGQYRAFQRDIETTKSKLNTFEHQVNQTEQAEERAERRTGAWASKLRTGLAMAAAAATAALGMMFGRIVQGADEIETMAAKTGLSAERIQELQYIAASVDGDIDALATSQARLTRNMDMTAKGTGQASAAFQRLGVSVTDSNGNLRDAKLVMMEAFGALSAIGNETERDALALQLFGRGAQELNPFITAGTDTLAKLAQQARDTGAVMSEESVEALDQFADGWEQLKLSAMGVVGTVLGPLMPVLVKLMQLITAKLAPAMRWLSDKIIPAITDAFSGASDGMSSGAAIIGTVFTIISTLLGFLRDRFVLIWSVITQAVQLFTSFLSGPTGSALIQGLLGIIGRVMALVGDIFAKVWGVIRGIISGFIDWFNSDSGASVIQAVLIVLGAAMSVLETVWKVAWPVIKAALSAAWWVMEPILEKILVVVNKVTGAIRAAAAAWDDFKSGFTGNSASADANDAALGDMISRAGARGVDVSWIANIPTHASGGLFTKPHLGMVAEDGPEAILPLGDRLRSLQILGQSGLLGDHSVSNSSVQNVYNVTVERGAISDFQGLIASIQAAQRMGVATA